MDLHPEGVVFGCTTSTYRECMQRQLFGLPKSYRELVERIVLGTELFLFNYETRQISVGFIAESEGGWDLEPGAFDGRYKAQVRMSRMSRTKVLDECDYKHLVEYFPDGKRIKFELTDKQVQGLLEAAKKKSPTRRLRDEEITPQHEKRPRVNKVRGASFEDIFDIHGDRETLTHKSLGPIMAGMERRLTVVIFPIPSARECDVSTLAELVGLEESRVEFFLLLQKSRVMILRAKSKDELVRLFKRLRGKNLSELTHGRVNSWSPLRFAFTLSGQDMDSLQEMVGSRSVTLNSKSDCMDVMDDTPYFLPCQKQTTQSRVRRGDRDREERSGRALGSSRQERFDWEGHVADCDLVKEEDGMDDDLSMNDAFFERLLADARSKAQAQYTKFKAEVLSNMGDAYNPERCRGTPHFAQFKRWYERLMEELKQDMEEGVMIVD
ncbi:hypothetical protein BSKO_03569 [Bryopsis sp. KO-2023]|nr:hypothetical protein BSKO_03569 [Bryopsis sp. KO-2023]